MISLVGIGLDEGNISFNALKAIKDSDIIIKDVNFKSNEFLTDYVMVKKVLGDNLEDNVSKMELAIRASRKGQNVSFLSADYSNVHMANLLIQIASKYKDVELKIYPAISNVDFASSLLGAPLDDYAVINLNNQLAPFSEIEEKIKLLAKSHFVLAVYNPLEQVLDTKSSIDEISENNLDEGNDEISINNDSDENDEFSENENSDENNNSDEESEVLESADESEVLESNKAFKMLKEVMIDARGENVLTAIVNSDSSFKVIRLEDLDENIIESDSILIMGNKMTHLSDGYMLTGSDYIAESEIHDYTRDFYTRFLNGEVPHGIDPDCDYIPCHDDLEACDFCYCPFYPCADSCTGGEWIKEKNVWSCQNCSWVHNLDVVEYARPKVEEIIKEVDDLKDKHQELLKLRRETLLNTDLD